jgi:hypothetical protein
LSIKIPEKEVDVMVQMYNAGKNTTQIAEALHRDRHAVSRNLKKRGVDVKPTQFTQISKDFDKKYFDKIDTEQKAYILGLLFADGTCNKYGSTSIQLQECDKYILDEIKAEMKHGGKIIRIAQKQNFKECKKSKTRYRFTASCKYMTEKLIQMGMRSKEHIPEMPKEMIPHFLRGNFDGDGCIYVPEKPRSKSDGLFYFMGEQSFCADIVKYCRENNICDFTKIDKRKGIYQIRKSGNKQAMKNMYGLLYKNAKIYMKRKKEKWDLYMKRNPELLQA